MFRLARVLLLGVAGAIAIPTLATSARADGPSGTVTCTDQGACVVIAQNSGHGPAQRVAAHATGGTAAPECTYPPGSNNVVDCYDPALGWLNETDGCRYRLIPADAVTQAMAAQAGAQSPGGSYYMRTCWGVVGRAPGAVGFVQGVVWEAAPPPGYGGPIPPPAVLAQRAMAELGLRGPQISLSPPLGGSQLVGLPTWMWTPVSAVTWSAHSATAAVPGESVTATARATSIRWAMGDGGTVVCANPGTPYTPTIDPHAVSPTCGYTYRTPSPAAGFRLTATTTWQVTWTGGGTAGQLTLQRSSTAVVPVVEAEAVNR